jgi:hypothetical protein
MASRMKALVQFLPVLFLGACTTHAFTPSARPMPMSPVEIPKPHEHDLQIDGNIAGELLGPGISAGNVRYRRGVAEHVAVVADTGLLRVDQGGDDSMSSSLNPYAGTARIGAQLTGDATDELEATVFTGGGAGYSPVAGGWMSGDLGFAVSGDHRYVRPVLQLSAYVSQPVGTKVFSVNDTMLRLPLTVGLQGLFGFDLGPRSSSVMLGLAVGHLWTAANDKQDALSELFMGLGVGFRFGQK